MSNLFTPVDYDNLYPAKPADAKVEVNEEPMTAPMAVDVINLELNRIRFGTSKLTANAVNFKDDKSPFCTSLKRFAAEPSTQLGLDMSNMATQDFGKLFGDFVANLMVKVFEGKK